MIKFVVGFTVGIVAVLLVFIVFSLINIMLAKARSRRMYKVQIKYVETLVFALNECKRLYPNESIDNILANQKDFLTTLNTGLDNI